jgi:protein adenylyltransferase
MIEAIWAAIDQRDDWGPFHEKVDAIRAMGAAMAA